MGRIGRHWTVFIFLYNNKRNRRSQIFSVWFYKETSLSLSCLQVHTQALLARTKCQSSTYLSGTCLVVFYLLIVNFTRVLLILNDITTIIVSFFKIITLKLILIIILDVHMKIKISRNNICCEWKRDNYLRGGGVLTV